MSKFEVELKQHTPIIQFQGEQYGASLRASEFKPKLDKFLIKYVFNDTFEEYKKYLIGYKSNINKEEFGDKKPLNYKVKFKNIKMKSGFPRKIDQYYPFYFNNIGKNKDKDKNQFVMCDRIYVEFFSLNKELIDIIRKCLDVFLIINNFGFRQNKGFGSFTVKENEFSLDQLKAKAINYKKLKMLEQIYYIEYDKEVNSKTIMEDAEIIYKLIKSGINYPKKPKSYNKSFLFTYMLSKNIGNEKKKIKEEFFHVQPDKKEKKYVRALLGVGNGAMFKADGNIVKKLTVKYKSNHIERFPSPILFKIIDNYLIIVLNDVNEEIYDKKFTFSSGMDKFEIYTPKKEEFNLIKFFEKFIEYFKQLKFDESVSNHIQKRIIWMNKRGIKKVNLIE